MHRVRVTLVSKQTLASTLSSYKLHVQELSKRRDDVLAESEVTLLHFKGWPDLDVPSRHDQLMGFQELVRLLTRFYVIGDGSQKALIHCRQGHGRTGTLLTVLTRLL